MSILEADQQLSDTTEDLQLVRQAQAGDRDAFVELVRIHHQAVIGRVSRLMGQFDVAEDIAQEVFLAAFRSMESFKFEGPFRAWLFGIARNKSMSALRSEIARQKRETNSVDFELARWQLENLEDERSNQQELVEDQFELLQSCLEKLSRQNRETLKSFYQQGKTAVQIAQKTGRKAGAVRMMLLRIRKALQFCIEQHSKDFD